MPIVQLIKRDTPCTCTSILLVVEGIQWKGYSVNTTDGGKDTAFTSILLVIEMDTPCKSIMMAVESRLWKRIHFAIPKFM